MSRGLTRKVFGACIVLALVAGIIAFTGQIRASGSSLIDTVKNGRIGVQWFFELMGRLDLSAEQQEQVKAVLREHKADLLTIAGEEQQTRDVLRKAIRRPSVDEGAIRAAAADVAAVDSELAVHRAQIFARAYPVLTAAQQSELKRFIKEKQAIVQKEIQKFVANPDFSALGFDRLNLSDEQKAAIEAVLESHKKRLKSLSASEKLTRQTLAASIHRLTFDGAAVRKASAAVAAVDADLSVERARLYSEVSALLDADQQAELDAILAEITKDIEGRIQAAVKMFELLV